MNTKIKLRIQGLTNSQIQSKAYALILAEEEGIRRIPIVVGTAEAQSIAIALEDIIPPRPLTHDLFVSFMNAIHIELKEVLIYKFEDGIFYSELLFDNNGEETRLDSRTSDAIAIAIRANAIVYTTENILRECGVVLEEMGDEDGDEEEEMSHYAPVLEPEDFENPETMKEWLEILTEEELQLRMKEAIEKENYEHAKLYKDELHRRNGKKQ